MKFLKLIPILLISFGISPLSTISYAEIIKDPKDYKVLNNKKLSTSNVEAYIIEGDKLIKNGDFEQAKENYDKARELSRKLASYYSDLNRAFRGIDARVPLEMEKKGKESIRIWAKSSSRLAALYKRRRQPEVAVPLLVEIIRLMSPNSPEGKKAYESLIELGFTDTTYKGF